MLQEIQIPRGSKFRVQRDFQQKYPEYEWYIAVGSDIDLVADTEGDQVPSDGYNDGRAHITVVTFLHCFVLKHWLWTGINPEKKRCWNTWPMDVFCGLMRWRSEVKIAFIIARKEIM